LRIWRVGLLGIGCLLATGAAEPTPFEVQLGDQKLTLVAPAGFTDGCAARADIRRLFEASQPKTNAVHACFIADDEFPRWDELGPDDDAPIMTLTSVRQLDGGTTSPESFAAIVKLFEEQQQSGEVLNRAAGEASAQLGSDVAFSSFGIVPAGFFSKTEKTFGFAVLRTISVETEEGTVPSRQAVASMILHIQGKVLAITVEKESEVHADITEVIGLVKSWAALQPL
jgi:hypothetical protein